MKTLLIFLFFFPAFVYSQGVLEDKAYGLISQIFAEKEKENFKLDLDLVFYDNRYFKSSEVLNLDFLKQYILTKGFKTDTTIFNQDDVDFMGNQVEMYSDLSRLNQNDLSVDENHLLLNDNRTEQEHLFPKFTTYKVSWPLFSKDENKALMYVENYCGIECGGGQINIYVLTEDNVWKFIGAIPMWVS